jgi:hypothetical protein
MRAVHRDAAEGRFPPHLMRDMHHASPEMAHPCVLMHHVHQVAGAATLGPQLRAAADRSPESRTRAGLGEVLTI